MSYKFDSLIIILNKLDSGEEVTPSSLSRELEVSQRTVLRYMSTLLVAGFPIYFDRNRESYVFEEGYTLKRPELSFEETLAFALARKFLTSFGPGMEKSLVHIENTISRYRAVDIKHILISDEFVPGVSDRYLGLLHRAIYNYQKIRITYKALRAGKLTEGVVDPYYLFFREGIWYLRGYYYHDNAVRTFALDRIVSLDVLDDHYVSKRVSPEEELSGGFGAFIDGEPVEVVLVFDEQIKSLVLRKKWHKSQTVTELEDGKCEMRLTVNGLIGIKNWIYRWIPHVRVVAPEILKDALKKDLNDALRRHRR